MSGERIGPVRDARVAYLDHVHEGFPDLILMSGWQGVNDDHPARSLSSSVRHFAFEFSERRRPPLAC